VEPGTRLVAVLLNVLDLDPPLRRVKRWSICALAAIAFLCPNTFRAELLQFAEVRACSIDLTLSHEFTMSGGSFRVVEANGWCELHFDGGKAS
jgi:hypothetical protein